MGPKTQVVGKLCVASLAALSWHQLAHALLFHRLPAPGGGHSAAGRVKTDREGKKKKKKKNKKVLFPLFSTRQKGRSTPGVFRDGGRCNGSQNDKQFLKNKRKNKKLTLQRQYPVPDLTTTPRNTPTTKTHKLWSLAHSLSSLTAIHSHLNTATLTMPIARTELPDNHSPRAAKTERDTGRVGGWDRGVGVGWQKAVRRQAVSIHQ